MDPSQDIEELNERVVPRFEDTRGKMRDFKGFVVRGLHVITMQPGSIRGNHVHDQDEIVCVVGGNEKCKITVEDEIGSEKHDVTVDADLKACRIKAGVKHTIKNTGSNPFYLVCFYEAASKSSAS